MVRRLKAEGNHVVGVGKRPPVFGRTAADFYTCADLRSQIPAWIVDGHDEIYQLAADMGGAGYTYSGLHDADIARNNAQISANVLRACRDRGFPGRLFFASSSCVYPRGTAAHDSDALRDEADAYPAAPDSDYGWEKLFAERMYLAHARNYGATVRIGRLHTVYGPGDKYDGGREKVPAALCRKVAMASDGGEIEVWGDGNQTRTFTYIDDTIEGIIAFMRSDRGEPTNIGSEELVSIDELARKIIAISGKQLTIRNIEGPVGVRGRGASNAAMFAATGWRPWKPLDDGLRATYGWIEAQIRDRAAA
jgi:nucleoside-diphosphate-sugar epimerase